MVTDAKTPKPRKDIKNEVTYFNTLTSVDSTKYKWCYQRKLVTPFIIKMYVIAYTRCAMSDSLSPGSISITGISIMV